MMLTVVVVVVMMLTVVVVVVMMLTVVVVMMLTVVVIVVTMLTVVVIVVMMLTVVVVVVTMLAVVVVVVTMLTVVVVVVMMAANGAGLLPLQALQLGGQGVATLHSCQQLLTRKLLPIGGNDHGILVVGAEQLHRLGDLFLGQMPRMGKDDGAGVLYLIVEEFPKVFHIHFALGGVYYGDKGGKLQAVRAHILHGTDHVRELAHAGGLDQDAVGVILLQHLHQGLAEIAHQRAADAARIHLGDADARLLQKAPVNADLAEFVLDQHQSLALVAVGDQFFDEGGFTGTQKAGENINFGH